MLTSTQVNYIRNKYARGVSIGMIAGQLKVPITVVRSIVFNWSYYDQNYKRGKS